MFDLKYLINLSKGRRKANPSARIAMGFAFVILAGALILMLPVSARERQVTPFLSALFTSTSATCVTGLVVFDTYTHWSLFGQMIILLLIQIGGLGFMTIVTMIFVMSNRQIGIKDRMVMMQSFGLENMGGVIRIMRHAIQTTLVIEGFGAVVLSCCYIPRLGFFRGVWSGIFHSVSAFCNAGFDINGIFEPNTSVMRFGDNPVILLTLSALIIVGGLGFFVWEDIYTKKCYKKLSAYSKLVLITTGILLIFGCAGILFFEYGNPQTIGESSFPVKLLNSFFQSVTSRTAGFDSIGQQNMTQQSKVLTTLLMMIGGSSGSTAGGVKTGTVAIVLYASYTALVGRYDTVILGRRISHRQIITAFTLMITAILLNLTGAMIISAVNDTGFINSFYETASAYATVGLTAGVTDKLNDISRLILIIYMFLGRVGLTTVVVTIMMRSKNDPGSRIRYPSGRFLIG